jgi:class 3 adenylate cyclase/tetratricopeptide (TPR) repeat protein
MHRVVPELIIEKYRAGIFSGEFPAVGMFLDLSGFSSMTDTLMQHGQHGAEVLANLMHGVFDPLVEGIFDHGGKIVGFAGDGIMALYPIEGDPASTCISALSSAWLIQRRLAQDAQRRTIYGTFEFTARIGLTCGTVSWGILHSENRKNATYFFRGSAVDDCAQAEQHAGLGEILITDDLYRQVSERVQVLPGGSFHRLVGFHADLPGVQQVAFPPVDLEISRIFMPEEIVAQDAHGEFRQVVNLFIRFPELSNEKLQEIIPVVFRLREQYGGLLNRVDFGDKGCNLLMLWGAPVAYENDIHRALNFILDLKAQVDIPVTAGVTYYIAHAGYLGSVMCEDYTCYGWGVNLASRFMMSAPLGEIWVDDRIARRMSSRFTIEYVGDQRFKGFSTLQRVNRLKSYNLQAEPAYPGEMIGREREMAHLEKFVVPIWKGDFAGTLLVLGDAGIGKGRLVQGFRSSGLFESKDVLWALCQSEQILRQSFNPFRSWLIHYFGFTATQDPEQRKETFDAKIDTLLACIGECELAAELDRLRSMLGALVDLVWENSLYESLDAEARYNSTLLALIALVKAESLCQPIILFVEDMQFIDEDSLSFLPLLKRSILAGDEFYPVAIIATSRIEGRSPLLKSEELFDIQINLKGLAREAVARLVEILIGGVPSLDLVNLVMERSEGNPYFVEQIVRYLQEEKLIEMSADGWKQVKRVRDSFLPGDIGALLVARLDQLSRKVREVVHTASVLGREFMLDVLSEMTIEAQLLEQYVITAEQSAIWIGEPDGRYVFTHGLLRDAAYSMQMRARRQELHSLAVKALEKIYAEELKLHYAELAYHAERAELRERTQQYYSLAGKAASAAYQNAKGVEYLSRALSFTPFSDVAGQFDLLVERVELFRRLGDRIAHLKDLESLERLARELDDPQREAMVEMLFAHYHVVMGNYQVVLRHAERVLDISSDFSDADIVLKTYQVWPLALLRIGKVDEAMKVAQTGRQIAQQYGDSIKEGYILISMGLIAIEQRDPSIAQGFLEAALAISRAASDRRLESRALDNLGYSSGFVLQDYALAREYYEMGYELHRQSGDRAHQNIALGNLGWVASRLGDFEAALSYYARALATAREIGSIYLETNTLINMSGVAGIIHDAEASLEYAQRALELARKTADLSSEAWAFLYMGYAYLLRQDLVRADETFRLSMQIREELGQPGMKTEPAAGLIQVLLLKAEHELALAETDKVFPLLQNGEALQGTEEPLRVYHACYLALEHAHDPRARTVLRSAAQLLETQVSKLGGDDAKRMFVENVPWRLAIRQAWTQEN